MRVGLYNPYLTDVLGGGERHFLTIAACLSQKHQVEIIIPEGKTLTSVQEKKLLSQFNRTFNLDLKLINFKSGPFGSKNTWWQRLKFTRQYDIFYYMTDGSFFIPRAKKNIVHLQIPFKQKLKLSQRFKLNFWEIKTANSEFTKKWLEKHWRIRFDYLHRGSINTHSLKPAKKQNIILNVGRFTSGRAGKHCKRQDFLVKTFKKIYDQGSKDWRLVFHGPIQKGKDNQQFASKVKHLAKGYPITFKHQSSFSQLAADYAQAKIYWHAAGYGVDEAQNPQAVEHLGLTTAEAMASGCVPVVINKGGQPEVVTHAVNGLLWNTQKEIIDQTLELIEKPEIWQKLSKKAIIKSTQFSQERFCQLTRKIFSL